MSALRINVSRVPSGRDGDAKLLRDFLFNILDRCGYEGSWNLSVKNQTKSTTRFCVRTFDRHDIKLRMMPGDSGTCWECELTPPRSEAVVAVGNELTLWNGYDGKNDPKAWLANVGEGEETTSVADEPPGNLSTILIQAEKLAAAFESRGSQIRELRAKEERLLREADQCHDEADKLTQEEAADEKGREAKQMLDSFRRLMAVK